MALTASDKCDTACTIRTIDAADSEATLVEQHNSLKLPLWPRILTVSLHSFNILSTISILGLLGHTMAGYSGTTGINFGGSVLSWPDDIDLHPMYFFSTTSAITLIVSSIGLCFTLLRLKRPSFTPVEIMLAMFSILILILWIAADFLEAHSEVTPKKSLLAWACRRGSSPTNILVRYGSICQEQLSVKYLAIVITVAQVGVVLSTATTWHFAEKQVKAP